MTLDLNQIFVIQIYELLIINHSGILNIKREKDIDFMDYTRSLTAQTSEKLTDYIIENDLTVGDKLPSENELCELLKVSRTTLRESLRMLTSRNILESRQGAGIFVCKNTGIPDDPLGFLFVKDKQKLVSDLLELRMLVEPRIAARAAQNATPEQAEELSRLADAVEKKYTLGESHSAEDAAFHSKLGELSDNVIFPNLTPIISQAIDMFIELTHASLKEETIATHRAIVDAVRKNDATAAEDAMYLHLVYNRLRLQESNAMK